MKAWVLMEDDRIVAVSTNSRIDGAELMELPEDMELDNLHKYRRNADKTWEKSE